MVTTNEAAETGGSRVSDDQVPATEQQILESMNAPKEAREDITELTMKKKEDDVVAILARFEAAEKVIKEYVSGNASSPHSPSSSSSLSIKNRNNRTLSHSLEDSPTEAFEFLSAVDEILDFKKDNSLENKTELLSRANSAVLIAMFKLEDEFRDILIHNIVPLDPNKPYLSLSFVETDISESSEDLGEVKNEGSATRRKFSHKRGVNFAGDSFIDLIKPAAVLDSKEIAQRMIRSGYEKECVQVYQSARREALDGCLMVLGVEEPCFDEMQKIEFKDLDKKIKKWPRAIKITVRVLLSAEMKLCDDIFGDAEIKKACFEQTFKPCIRQLLHFGEAVVIGRRSSNKLFGILNMYNALANVLQHMQAVVTDESVRNEAESVLVGLGNTARRILREFWNNVLNEASRRPVANGEVLTMVRHVMDYLTKVARYANTLNTLLALDNATNEEEIEGSENMSLLAKRLLRVITDLEASIQAKSLLFEDEGLQMIYLMNNLHHMISKVERSKLRKLLGDCWIKRQSQQIGRHEASYLRACWSEVRSCLSYDPRNPSKRALIDKCKRFNSLFKEQYAVQTGWLVSDLELRQELRLLVTTEVIAAYRGFYGRFKYRLKKRADLYLKYTQGELEDYVLNLFEGKQMVVKRSS